MASSTTMPPPPSPLAHRRTRPSTTSGASSCVPRKMSLSKADTFHQPSSPSTADDPVVSVAHLSKRSTTYTRSSFASWLYSGREAAADVIADFEQTFSGARGPRPGARRRSAREFEDALLVKARQRASSPVDSGIGSSIGSPSEKSLSRTLDKALDLVSNKDSALGDSVTGSVRGGEILIQETDSTKRPKPSRSSGSNTAPLTIIRYSIPSTKKATEPFLSNLARRQIYKRLFAPLLQDSRFEEFKPIVSGTRHNRSLRCLRDIEQSLINQPVTLVVTPAKYRSFGELTVQLVVDTYQHLSEAEQRRSTDQAYDNGYFLDLVQQVQQLAAHIGSSDTTIETGTEPTVDDEITLEGGLAGTGNLAELVRWKNGEGISLRTGLPYVPMAGLKRAASSSLDAQLSARRKKGVEYPVLHLPCREPGCDKVFNRQCDLGKHEKTHTRPFKCPEEGCKFNTVGLPTEKELDRHMNDKHNSSPRLFKCQFCEFSTKRESNCKQHMEKKHNWLYQRSKGRDKAANLTPKSTPKTPAMAYPSAEQSPAAQQWETNSIAGSMYESPAGQTVNFNYAEEYPAPLFARRGTAMASFESNDQFNFNAPIGGEQLGLNTNMVGTGFDPHAYPTPASAVQQRFTPQTPAYSNITPSPMLMTDNNVPNYGFSNDMPTPDSMPGHSRHVSNAHEMQAPQIDTDYTMGFDFNDISMEMPADFQLITSNAGAFTHEAAAMATLFPGAGNMLVDNEYTPEQFGAAAEYTNDFEEDSLFGI